MPPECPFCEPKAESIWFDDHVGSVLWDAFPISKGHALVVPKKHVTSLYDLAADTQVALWQLVSEARRRLHAKYQAEGFNIGLNDGEPAGQTVLHAHIHVIPRWKGDVTDPRGGIRWIIPNKACYWGNA